MDDLKRYLVAEAIEDYHDGRVSRRVALRTIGRLTGAVVAAELVAACAPRPREALPARDTPTAAPLVPAERVAPDDPAIVAREARFDAEGTRIAGYLARPAALGRNPVVLICHENRGLTPHIQDVTRRVAKAGYVGLAVDLLSREGGTAGRDASSIPGLLGSVPPERHVGDFVAALAYARQQDFARYDRAAIIGFCFGGGIAWRVATRIATLNAAVPFYGPPPPLEDLSRISAAVLAIYAGRDERIDQTIPAVESAMRQAGKTFKKVLYPDVDHAFHNDTGDRYNREAASAAWSETLTWLGRYARRA